MRHTTILILLATPCFAVGQETAPAAKQTAILADHEKAVAAYRKRLQSAKGVAEQGVIFRKENPHPATAQRLLELAKAHPQDPVAYASLVWIVETTEFGPASEKPYAEAIDLLATRYVDHKDNGKLLERMAKSPFLATPKFLQAVFDKHPSAGTRGQAGFHLGLCLKNYAATVERLRSEPEMAKNAELVVGLEMVKAFKDADTTKLLARADEVFARVQKDYPFHAYKKTNLARAAEGELYELRRLQVGMTVPELEGEDTDGKPIKLSDYRGKVTVVAFWGTWCPHCMAMVPTERALVKRYEGQPFAMVGVNSDVELGKLKPALVKHGITWRSFYDGPTADGPIASKWNVQGWPSIYVLDTKGVIRFRELRGEQLERAVAALMKEIK